MSQFFAVIDSLIGESLHTLPNGTANDIYANYTSGDALPSTTSGAIQKDSQQAIAVKALGANPMYIGFKSGVLSATRFVWKVAPADTQSTIISVAANAQLFIIGTNGETYSLSRLR